MSCQTARGTTRWFALAPVFPAESLALAFVNAVLSLVVYLGLVMTYVLPGDRLSKALGSYSLRRLRALAAAAMGSGESGQGSTSH